MSDDSADLGGFGPTTPVVHNKTSRSKPKSKTNAQAGPSTTKSTKPTTTSRKRQRVDHAPPPGVTDTEVINVLDDDDEEEEEDDELASTIPEEPLQRKPSSNTKSRTKASVTTNGKQSQSQAAGGKGRGRGKAAAATASSSKAKAPIYPEQIDVDNVEGESEDGSVAPSLVRAINRSSNSRPQKRSKDEYQEEKLRKRAEQAEALCEQLRKQVEGLLRVRETEAEQLLREERAQNEAEQKVKDQLIRELNSQLAKVEPLSRKGKTSVINLLTREAADIEKQELEKELMQYKELVKKKEATLKEKDDAIADLEQNIKELRFELDVERQQKAAPPKPVPGSAQRGRRGMLGSDEPKNTQLVKAYEDLTNLLIFDVKPLSRNYFDLDDWLWTCIYTYVSQDGSMQKSLNFQIKAVYEVPKGAPEPTSKDELIETIYYVPLELDKETPDFVEKLGFLGATFSFNRIQLALFLRTMHDHFGKALGEEQSTDISMESNQVEDDEVQFVE